MSGKFEDRKIVVIGASSGLGFDLIRWLNTEGARVCSVARRDHVNDGLKFLCDVTKPTEMKDLIENLKSFCPDTIIHCVGGGLGLKSSQISRADFQKLIDVNFLASVEINNALIPDMVANGRGWVLHIGSIAIREVTASVGYTCVKAMIPAYVKIVGRELIGKKVYISGINLGAITGSGGAMDRLALGNPSAMKNFLMARRPTGRATPFAELAHYFSVLLSDAAIVHASNMINLDEGEALAI